MRKILVVASRKKGEAADEFAIDKLDHDVVKELVRLSASGMHEQKWQRKAPKLLRELVEVREDDRRVEKLRVPASLGCLPNAWLARLDQLKHLDLSHTKHLARLPDDIGELPCLTVLDLKFSAIAALPPSIGRLRNLEVLDLSGTQATARLNELPEDLGNLERLEELNLSGSRIASLPQSLGKLQNLKILNLSGAINLPPILPECLWELSGLTQLNLTKCKINFLPSSIEKLQNLEDLNLAWTVHLESLPEEVGNLPFLRRLNLLGSGVTALPVTVGRRWLSGLQISCPKALLEPSTVVFDRDSE